jgi:hypothetical protein
MNALGLSLPPITPCASARARSAPVFRVLRTLDPRTTVVPYISSTGDDAHVAPLEGCARSFRIWGLGDRLGDEVTSQTQAIQSIADNMKDGGGST